MATSTETPAGDLATQILHALDKNSPLLSSEAFPAIPSTEVKGALDRLASRDMVNYETIDREEAILEAEGEQIAANGSHEARVFEALRAAVEGLTIQELENAIGDKNVVKIGQGRAFREKWISKMPGRISCMPWNSLFVTWKILLFWLTARYRRWQAQSLRM
jgi:phenylalanyl-tRNA synthetase alpha chain